MTEVKQNNSKGRLIQENQLTKISQLYLKGVTIDEIAISTELSQKVVSKSLDEIRRRWMESQMKNYNQRKAMELERLDMLEKQYWEAWEKSKNGQKKFINSHLKRQSMRGETSEILASSEVVDIPGDPRYLEGVLKCSSLRSKILGLEEATKIEYSGNISHSFSLDSRKKLTEEERIEAMMKFVQSQEVTEEVYEPTFAITESPKAGGLQEIIVEQNSGIQS